MSDVRPSADAEKKRILVLADSHGRNISGILSFVLRRRSEVLVIFKPNATLGCVAEDIDRLTTSFTMADVVVLIGGTNDLDRGTSAALVSTIDGLQRRLQQRTRLIVATLPRRYDSRKYNGLIDELNGGIRALKSRYGRMKILELGDLGKDYHTNQGLHLNVKGKVQLCLKLCKEMDSLPRESILRPPVRKVAEFLRLFTMPDNCRINYESSRGDSDINTSAAPRTRKAKLHRPKYILIVSRITVPASVGVQRQIPESMVSKPFEVFMAAAEEAERGDYTPTVKPLRIRRTNSYWVAGNTICVQLLCQTTNRCPFGMRLGRREDVKLHVMVSQLRTVFKVAETGLRFPASQQPAVIVVALDFGNFFNVDKNNVNLTFEESTVRTTYKKRACELSLYIRGKMWLVYSPGTSRRVVANRGDSRNNATESTTKAPLDGDLTTFSETLPTGRGTDAECTCLPPDIVAPAIRFIETPLNLRPDVTVFRPALIASSHLFVIYFRSSDHTEITLYSEIFVITNATLVRYVTVPVTSYVIFPKCPKPVETFRDGFAEQRIDPYKSEETRWWKVYFFHRFTPDTNTSRHIHLVSARRGPDESELSEDDVILAESLVRLIKRSFLYFKMKNLATVAVRKGKTRLKRTRKGAITGGGAQEVINQLTKVTTAYLSCCGDFNTSMIGRRLKSGKECDAYNLNSLL